MAGFSSQFSGGQPVWPHRAHNRLFAYRWEGDASSAVNGIVPIGRPFPELDAIVVDDALQPVPVGASGELLVGGPQTAPGYWLDADRTDECFIRLPFSPTRGQRFYRTGDRVVLLESGQYAFLGRVDHQIKVLGYRVELGEIEAVLMRDGGAVQAVAAGWPVEDGRALGIVAFVSGSSKLPAELIMLARRVLPAYMVPSRVVVLDEMPLNANGKIDRAKLLADLGPLVAA